LEKDKLPTTTALESIKLFPWYIDIDIDILEEELNTDREKIVKIAKELGLTVENEKIKNY